MQKDGHNSNRHHSQYASIDGFLSVPPRKKINHPDIAGHSKIPASPDSITPMPSKPSHSEANNGPSLLNLNIAGESPFSKYDSIHLKKRKPWKRYALRSSLVLIAIFLVVGGWVGFKFFRNIAKITHNNNPLAAIASALNQVNLKSEGDWVNVLVAGYDPTDGDITTDTIMVVSVNKTTNQAIMLSVPRDTWVNNVPGFGHQKINASNDVSSFNVPGYPKGGMGELEQQIHDKLGIKSDYYVLVNNNAYVDGVNAVGGIDVNIQSSDHRGLYDPNVDKANGGPLNLTNGPHHLNGLGALALVKARGDSYYAYGFPQSDFDREAHARQVVLAMKDKALTTGVATDPVKIGQLLDAVGKNVQTDITLNDASGFYKLMKKVNNNNVKSMSLVNINGTTLLKGQVVGGLDAEVPTAGIDNFTQIQNSVSKLYSANPVFQESATVVILNGSNLDGLASKEETILNNEGFSVIQVGDPNAVYPKSMIIDQSNGKDPASAMELQKLFSTNTAYTTTLSTPEANEAKNYYSANFVIVLGQNWNTTTTQ